VVGAKGCKGSLFSMSEIQLHRAKPLILIFVRYYLPGFRAGGPVRSISNLVRALDKEYDFRIVCLHRDHGEITPYHGITSDRWTQQGASCVYYASDSEAGFSLCIKLIRETKPDMIYLNSLFERDFSMKPFLAAGCGRDIPILLTPRGELSPGALGLKSKRKALFLSLIKASKYYRRVNWHASSTAEEARIQAVFSPDLSMIFAASNLPESIENDLPRTGVKARGGLKIVLAARISPMKNTLGAIRMTQQLRGDVELDLWGPLEDREYWADCENQLRSSPPNVSVRYQGEVTHEKLQALLHRYDVMLLPTLGENFGHSIIEALSAGLPVVISDRTPWRNLMSAGVGADISLENEPDFLRQLEIFQAMDANDMESVRATCRAYAVDWKIKHCDLDSYRKMFDTVIASRTQPCR
jgi:glycosyltransferase involved in cell wall biosynthesis